MLFFNICLKIINCIVLGYRSWTRRVLYYVNIVINNYYFYYWYTYLCWLREQGEELQKRGCTWWVAEGRWIPPLYTHPAPTPPPAAPFIKRPIHSFQVLPLLGVIQITSASDFPEALVLKISSLRNVNNAKITMEETLSAGGECETNKLYFYHKEKS